MDLSTAVPHIRREWVRDRIPHVSKFSKSAQAIGVIDAERNLIAAVVYDNYRPKEADVEMSIAADDPRWCRRGILCGLFSYPFKQLDCRRVTAFTRADNEGIIKFMQGLGFVHEGTKRKGLLDGTDALAWGMLKEECKWLV